MTQTKYRNKAAWHAQWLAFLLIGCVALISLAILLNGGWSHWTTAGVILGIVCLIAFVQALVMAIRNQHRL